jgi:hypothetical protein
VIPFTRLKIREGNEINLLFSSNNIPFDLFNTMKLL